MKKILTSIITIVALLTAISKAETKLTLPTDVKPFFIHRTVENAWGHKIENGIYCYMIEQERVVGPFVEIYIVENGKVTEMVSQGSDGKALMERIRKIGVTPFDFKDEIEKTIDKLAKEHKKKDRTRFLPVVMDGHSYEIIYDLDNTKLKIHANNPGYTICALAEHNEDIGKLYAVYKELMLYYAERKFHFK